MTKEQVLMEKWRSLAPDQQQAVLAFVDQVSAPKSDSPMGQKLRSIRQRIVESGMPLLDDAELAIEMAERRQGHIKKAP
jgi:TRAP-type C4-dicarboxylate transport system substrate-binding protein